MASKSQMTFTQDYISHQGWKWADAKKTSTKIESLMTQHSDFMGQEVPPTAFRQFA